MLGESPARRRVRRVLGPWLLLGVGAWLALDNGPALLDEWRLRDGSETGMATIVSVAGGAPQRSVRRLWDDLVWGRGRRVVYRFGPAAETARSGFLTHSGAAAVRQGGTVTVRYLAADPTVHRIAGQPGILLLAFRFLLALTLAALGLWLLRRTASRRASATAADLTAT